MINLLPPQQKEELFQEQKYKLLLILGILAVFLIITIYFLLFSAKIFISGKAQGEKIIISPELQDSEKEITEINESLQNLNSFYNKQPDFEEILERISQILPTHIYLNSILFNFPGEEENFSVSLQGFSPIREDLLQLKRNLELEPNFKDINFPLSNLLKPKNIEFNISFNVGI